MKKAIKVRNISKTIGRKKILDNISFDIYENDILVLENNKYIKDDELKNKRVNMLKEKLERLKNSQFRE